MPLPQLVQTQSGDMKNILCNNVECEKSSCREEFHAGVCSWQGPFEILRQLQHMFTWILLWDVEMCGRLFNKYIKYQFDYKHVPLVQ